MFYRHVLLTYSLTLLSTDISSPFTVLSLESKENVIGAINVLYDVKMRKKKVLFREKIGQIR